MVDYLEKPKKKKKHDKTKDQEPVVRAKPLRKLVSDCFYLIFYQIFQFKLK